MAVFAVILEESEIVREYFATVDERLGSPDFFSNPFKGGVLTFGREDFLAVVCMEPLYPPVWYAGPLFLAAYFLFSAWWLLIPAAFFSVLGVFWSPLFFFLLLRAGLRRAGYTGPVRYVNPGSAWRWLLGAD